MMPTLAAEAKRLSATVVGGAAIILWAKLALFTTWAEGIPPFQLASLCFSVATAIGLVAIFSKGRAAWRGLQQPWYVWTLGVLGLFGCHFFYFVALGNAPAIEASLIVYVWPILLVLFSALLPGERLRWYHMAAALLGLAGAFVLVADRCRFAIELCFIVGYAAAVASAVIWASYSVLNRRFGYVPTDAVTGFCAGAAVLSFVNHALFETWAQPTPCQWSAILLLGLGPVGLAFFAWDYGVKHGNIQALGAFAYTTPLLSSAVLIVLREAEATWNVALACALIVGGALLGSLELLKRSRKSSPGSGNFT